MYKRIRCGDVVDRVRTYVGDRKKERSVRCHESSSSQRESNLRQSIRELTRLFNCNVDSSWLMLVLSYEGEAPADARAAEKFAVNFWRRLARILGPDQRPLGVWLTADKDSKSGEPRRLHHHVVIDSAGITIKELEDHLEGYVGDKSIEDIWGHGFVKIRRIEKDKTYKALADYLVRQSVSGKNLKKWHGSRGLERPVVEMIEYSEEKLDLRPPVGAEVLERSELDTDSLSEFLSTYEPRKGGSSRPARPRKRKRPRLTPDQKRRRGYYSKKRE